MFDRGLTARKRAWDNLQEVRCLLKDAAGIELPAPGRRIIDLEGRIVKDGVRKTVQDRQIALDLLLKAIPEFLKFTDQPLTLRGYTYAISRLIMMHGNVLPSSNGIVIGPTTSKPKD